MGMYEDLASKLINETDEDIKQANHRVAQHADETVPVLSGDLKKSMKEIKLPDGYGVSYNKEYALYVHENPNGRGYKWLEKAYLDNESEIDDIAGGVNK